MKTDSPRKNVNPPGIETESNDTCSCNVIHQEILDLVKKELPDEQILIEMSELFKILGDPTRVKILQALFAHEMCVCDIAALVNLSQSAISHQLRILKQARLVKFRREGKIVYYSLNDEHIHLIFDQAFNHVTEAYMS